MIISRVLNIDAFDDDKLELSYINSESSDRYGFEFSSNLVLPIGGV